ncbi:uncharacterized protein BXZ73DRAFT_53808 [Epithele typhae]|uniref:uncharacterized protein n=1 Tax=Epithele typhae TaxID=378194 RepID=UPI0020089777|nr:uncharacterized protein BXZ73DRAFT_53808 [Epithele typhae]KAH9916402.1 hypothetical protein BXZ73DRAFT_53808 [Epithele typhae]
MPETVRDYPDYQAAAKAACAWVEKGSTKVDRSKLAPYPSKVGPYKGQIVVARRTAAGVLEDIVRIDNDDTGKGIHFNAKNLSDTSDKLAARITSTIAMTPAARKALFEDYLKALVNLEGTTIWDWWRTGTKPTQAAVAESDEAAAEE